MDVRVNLLIEMSIAVGWIVFAVAFLVRPSLLPSTARRLLEGTHWRMVCAMAGVLIILVAEYILRVGRLGVLLGVFAIIFVVITSFLVGTSVRGDNKK
jgi:hypothetical protein